MAASPLHGQVGSPPWSARVTEQLRAPASVPRTDGLWVSAVQLVKSIDPLHPRDSLHPRDLIVRDFSSKLEGSGTLHLAEEVGKEARVRPPSELNGAERRARDMHGDWLMRVCKWHGARKPDEIPEPFTKLVKSHSPRARKNRGLLLALSQKPP